MIARYLQYAKDLAFPKLCMLCNSEETGSQKNDFCLHCIVNMPYTNHFRKRKNHAYYKLKGRVDSESVASLLNFYKYSDVKYMIHKLKYQNRKDIGYKLGKMAGIKAKQSALFNNIDLIVPIPLHKSKLRRRGYNQAAYIGHGIAEILDIPVRQDVICKHSSTASQTTKNRIERINNVLDSFSLVDKEGIRGRHILIVDDVLTTGATIEACALRLNEACDIQVSVLTACVAKN